MTKKKARLKAAKNIRKMTGMKLPVAMTFVRKHEKTGFHNPFEHDGWQAWLVNVPEVCECCGPGTEVLITKNGQEIAQLGHGAFWG